MVMARKLIQQVSMVLLRTTFNGNLSQRKIFIKTTLSVKQVNRTHKIWGYPSKLLKDPQIRVLMICLAKNFQIYSEEICLI